MVKFIGKNVRKKVVRPLKNSMKYKNVSGAIVADVGHIVKDNIVEDIKQDDIVGNIESEDVQIIETPKTKKENKKQRKNKEMVNENKLTQLEAIAGTDIPQPTVKVEKLDKGLYERTENSTVLLTEDNKMLLND